MLRQSFCFLPNIGPQREATIWNAGISDWSSFLETKKVCGIGEESKETHDALLRVAKQKLWEDDAAWFGHMLGQSEHWRVYNEFKEQAVYLDIETDGYYGSVTVVGLYDSNQTMTFVRGINLDKQLLQQQLAKYKMIVTFNGASFDLPVIKRYFNISTHVPHVDLRFVCQRAGLTGGLKAIERQLGIKRPEAVQGIAGSDAVYLWNQFKTTSERKYLDLLVQYNEEDVINLPRIADVVIPQVWNSVRNKLRPNSRDSEDLQEPSE